MATALTAEVAAAKADVAAEHAAELAELTRRLTADGDARVAAARADADTQLPGSDGYNYVEIKLDCGNHIHDGHVRRPNQSATVPNSRRTLHDKHTSTTISVRPTTTSSLRTPPRHDATT